MVLTANSVFGVDISSVTTFWLDSYLNEFDRNSAGSNQKQHDFICQVQEMCKN